LIQVIPTTVCYSTPERVKFISNSWSKRVKDTQLGKQMVDYNIASTQEVEEMSNAWLRWGEHEDAMLMYVDVAIVARKM
jgi:hypothetical protein